MKNPTDDKNDQDVTVRKRRSCLGCLGRGAIVLAGLLAIALISGAIYQAVASASDLKQYPPPGQLFNVGDHRLHLYCTGEGSPAVILEAGAGSPGQMWYKVQKEIANSTRVCSYDRAGFGWSDPVSGLQSPDQVGSDLHALLEAADIPAPYILVGHSAGGVYIRSFAAQYPTEVVGMVLVDSSHEGQDARFPPEYTKLNETQNYMTTFCQIVSPFGGMRISKVWNTLTAGYKMDATVGEAVLTTMYRTSFCRAMANEIKALSTSITQPGKPGSLGDLPLIVLTADTSEEEMQAQIPEYLHKLVGPEVISRVFEVSRELQQELVDLSTQGKQIMVSGSGHNIQLDQPGVVIDAILEVLGVVRISGD